MTTVTADRRYAAPAVRGSADFAGTGQLLRLYLRRDRIVLPLWVIAFGMLPAFYVASTKKLYGTPEDLANYAKSITDSPALVAMYGPVFSTDLGSMALWKAGPYFAMIAIATILTVIRHTRVEEETGRAELVGATSIGRYAGLTAGLLLTTIGCVLVGILSTAMLYSNDLPLAGSVAFSTALACSGLAWAGVAAVAAQVSTGARIARGVALGALAAAFGLRAVGDAGNGVLTWFSPLGWCIQMRAFAQERWWVLVPLLALAVLAVATAYTLLSRRDTGSGLLAERPGPPAAEPSLSGPAGLAWRLQRGSLLVWVVGFLLYGLLMGGAVKSVGEMINDNSSMYDMVTRMGGTDVLQDSFVTLAFTLLAAGAAAYSLSATLRLHDEESTQRAESTLAGAVGRSRYALSHIGFALLGPVLLLLAAGLAVGVVYGATDGDMAGKLTDTLGAAAVQVPAVWVVTGVAVAIYGIAPRLTPIAWGVLSVMIVISFVGSLDGLPQWIVDLVPFTHPPKLPGAEFEFAPVLWLLAVAAALIAVGVTAFRRRDLR
ncbi:ABC-2 type transport system permease protein [Nocardia tenerifensis]|uniref:ABC-2 type transport system permease protein n=1 Tax=Nocardia tenerifensis TaxID=228006 RepID=A0A318JXK1_9NOCA|nr:ABC transporter permease [Nocardia tenerifensis]PXX58390.1 ABC-2 type transport system permease protein [Nocardia tenerifensis]